MTEPTTAGRDPDRPLTRTEKRILDCETQILGVEHRLGANADFRSLRTLLAEELFGARSPAAKPVRGQLGRAMIRYLQVLAALRDRTEAAQYAPEVVADLRRQHAARQQRRKAG